MEQIEPNALCREYGLKDVKELAELTQANERTLYNWSKNKQQLFKLVIMGAAEHKRVNGMGIKSAASAFK